MSHLLHAVLLASETPHPPLSLIVSTQRGEILTLGFSEIYGTLQLRYSTSSSAPSPSWHCLSPDRRFLYTTEEQSADATPNTGAITSYTVSRDGQLERRSTAHGLCGPVSLDISQDGKLLFAACYDGKGVSTYQLDPENGLMTHLRDWTYQLRSPGPVRERQDAAHPHQALFDPTGRFVLVPDLGADLVRIFRVDGVEVEEHQEIRTKPGTGPRHGVFVSSGGRTIYYLVGEMSNTITAFTVSYPRMPTGEETIQLQELQTVSTIPGSYTSSTAAASEVIVKDSFLYVSNRGDTVFSNSDSITMYRIRSEDGSLEWSGFLESGVRMPRHISIDPSGQWLAACGQESRDVKVFRRNQTTGEIGKRAEATFDAKGGAMCAVWL